jgi:DNA-binding NtrC family response regulator
MGTVRVLLVDEDDDVLSITREFLEQEAPALDVETAKSAETAVDRAAGDDVDVVVTDLSMPEMDGVELAEALHERDPDLPCVLYTAHDAETVEAEYDTTLSGHVRKRTGTDQYAELADLVQELAD